MTQASRILGLLIGGFLLFFALMINPGILAPPLTLLFGWLPAGARLAGEWHPGKTGVILFVMALLALVSGTHAFLRWLYPSRQAGASSAAPGEWRWRWTLCGFGVLFFGMLAICCVVLTTHQLYWFSKSTDPMLIEMRRSAVSAMWAGRMLEKPAADAEWRVSKVQAAFLELPGAVSGALPFETVRAIWVASDQEKLRAIVLVPRRPANRSHARLAVMEPGKGTVTRKLEELPAVLASFGIATGSDKAKGSPTLLP